MWRRGDRGRWRKKEKVSGPKVIRNEGGEGSTVIHI